MTSFLRTLTGVSLLGGALAVGACGDDDSDGGSATGGSASTTGGKAATGGTPATGGVAPSGGKGGSTGGNATTGGSAQGGGGSGGDAGGSDRGGNAGDGAGGSGEGGAAGGDTGGFAGVPSEPEGAPLLERPVEGGSACELSQPLTFFDLDWNGADVAPGESPWVFWSAAETSTLIGAALNDGALGAPHTVHAPSGNGYVTPPSVARNGERITVAWAQVGDQTTRVQLAQVDADGEVVTEAHALPGEAGAGTFAIAAAGDGYGVVWTEPSSETTSTLKFQRLDADTNPVGTPKVLAEDEWLYVVDLVGLDDGFGVAYGHGYGTNDTVRYLGFDDEGTAYRESVPFAYSDVALLARGDRVLAAWTRATGEPSESLAVTLRVGWFDNRGNPVGDTFDVQSPVFDQENVDPAWVELGDDLGLAWSRGSVIYICAGCIPDNHVEFLALDGETLQPKSEVVSIENSDTNGGLMSSRLSASSGDVTVVSSVTYHTSAEGASSIISCTE